MGHNAHIGVSVEVNLLVISVKLFEGLFAGGAAAGKKTGPLATSG